MITELLNGVTILNNPNLDIISYHSPLMTVTVRSNRWIEGVDSDLQKVYAKETSEERRNNVIDFDALDAADKEGQSDANSLVVLWVTEGRLGNGSSSSDESNKYNIVNALTDTKSLEVRLFSAGNGGTNANPYPLLALRKKDGISNAAFFGLINGFNRNNDDYSMSIYQFNRGEIEVRTGIAPTWTDLDTNIEGFEFTSGTGQFTPNGTTDRRIFTSSSRRGNQIQPTLVTKPIGNDTYEYLVSWQSFQNGALASVALNPYSFNYQ